MKNKSVRRSVAGALASLMCALSVPAIPTAVYSTAYAASAGQKLSVGGGQTQHKGDNVDGYSYEIWLDRTGGSGSMTLGSGGSFDAQWSAEVSQGNFLARRGRNYDASKKATDYGPIVMDYAAQYSASAKGNSRLCVYGWFKDPLVEYYIIEDWVNWCPSGNGKTVTIDGAQYDIFQTPHTGPTILGDTRTFQQYFSVRKQKRTSGTITVSDHFKAWANAGMQIGNLTEVALNVEGWESSGRANVTKLTIGTSGGGGNNQQQNNNNGWNQPQQQNNNQSNTASTPTKQADANGYYFNSSFNSGVDGWTGRGAATVAKDSSNYAEGNGSIFVSGRTDNWNGAAIELDPSAFGAGQTYSFGAAVMQKSESSTSMKMTLQYTDASGTEQYDEVATATASNGKWTALGNPSYTIPSGASNLLLYIEAPDSLTDFYVDSAFGGVKGKSVSVSGGTTAQNNNNQQQNWNQPQQQNNNQQQNNWNQPQQQTNTNTNTSASQGTGLKGKFAPWFKIGTSVSPNELNSGASFLKENYNSITPENELKPDSILDQQACQQRGNNVNTQVNLSRAAQTLKFCEDNGISLRGHTFVWYSQTPDWFFRENFSQNGAYVSPQIMDQRLESFIKNTFDALKTQYPKLDIYSYDVCNELFVNDGGGLRPANNSNWVRVYGDDSFVIKAFQYARKYAPANCKLYINDYNEYIPAKTNDIYNMAMKLKELGVIDGIGMQSHLDTGYPDAKTYETALKKFLSTGLEVQITELDITCKDFSAQASLYESIFKLAMENSAKIPAVTIWGTQDNVSWRSSQNPLLFSQGYKPKPAYDKVVALAGSTSTPTNQNNNTQQQNQNNNQQQNWNQPQQQNNNQQQNWNQPQQQQNQQQDWWNNWNNFNWNNYDWNNNGWNTWNNWSENNSWNSQVSTWGDANNNGKVDIADSVYIQQSISNPGQYQMNDQSRWNSDVYQAGSGVTGQDANAIQRYLLDQTQNLPESFQPYDQWSQWNNNNNNQQQNQQQNWNQPQQQNNNQQQNNWNQPQQQTSAASGQKYSVGNGMNQHKADNVDGYSYEIWLDNTGGSGSMTLGSGGTFSTEWSAQVSQGNFLARRGRNYDASKKATQYGNIVMDYAAEYSASSQGNSRLCVYGWMKDPLVEYYIIEDWVNWCPSANGGAKTVTIDGAQYDIFQLDHTGPTILGDTRTFKQYFSVRKQKRTSGTITVSDHFKAWENAGWNIGNLTEVALNVEGWESSGKANVTKLTIGEGGGQTQQQNQQQSWTQPQEQQNNGWNNNGWNQSAQTETQTNVQVNQAQNLAGKKLVAISFDDGASAQSRQDPAYRIMDALIKNNFHATFFYVGDWIKTNEQVQFAYQNGMEVANHTKSHKSLGSLGANEIRSEWEQCNSKLRSIIGAEPSHIMRLPYLDGGGQVKQALYDVPLISCGVDTKDWDGASADQIVNTIKSAAQNGSLQNQIVLCHENYASTAQAMETVLPWLKQNGWEVVTVSEMFAANGKQLQGGQIYTRS
ncbi:MAG: Endo-1,4-beta-xylanase Y precursor [Firmicutes bacterium ADurb.BinA205]|nr:MAG: Endo-1,4-beta-xylanase Y precursor [Firmicutes bacterium ADurb.BinA205]